MRAAKWADPILKITRRLARSRHGQLVLLTQLIHAQDGDDVLRKPHRPCSVFRIRRSSLSNVNNQKLLDTTNYTSYIFILYYSTLS